MEKRKVLIQGLTPITSTIPWRLGQSQCQRALSRQTGNLPIQMVFGESLCIHCPLTRQIPVPLSQCNTQRNSLELAAQTLAQECSSNNTQSNIAGD